MKRHLIITVAASFFFGVGLAVKLIGITGIPSKVVGAMIYGFSLATWMIVAFTSLQEIKDCLKDKTEEQ